ncbi:MAG: thiol reductant ABC exporter subunit CydC [Alphaproteobacteria bacterium]
MAELSVFIGHMGRHWGWVLLGALLTLLTVACGIALFSLAGWFVTTAALGGAAVALTLPSIFLRVLAGTRVLSRYLERLTTHEATLRLIADLRSWFFCQAMPLAPSQLASVRSGDMLSRITADIDALDTLYLRIVVPTAVAALVAAAVTAGVAVLSPPMALALAAGLLFSGLLVPALALRRGLPVGRRLAQSSARARYLMVDLGAGLADLLSGRAGHGQAARVHTAMADLLTDRAHLARLRARSMALSSLFAQATLIGVIALAILLKASGDTPPAPLVAMIVFAVMASFEAVAPLAGAFQDYGRTREAARRLLDVADTRPLVRDPAPEDRIAAPERSDLRLEGVFFSYPGSPRRALDGVSLYVPAGRKMALIGPSGGGKTTLLCMLMRLYDPDKGVVRIGSADLRRLAQQDLWSRIGYLSQYTELFSSTIRGNILIGRPDADEDALWHAVRSAGLEDFVREQPKGLDTWVGEGGLQISGGEARRIALARVLLKDPPILLLDEPTEGLDAETEEDVLKALSDVSDGRTVLMVTHRGTFLERTDEIWIMEEGRLVNGGPRARMRAHLPEGMTA